MNPRDQERNCLNPHITKIILLAEDIRRWRVILWFSNLFQCHKQLKNPDAKAAMDKEWKKLETIPAWKLEKVQSKKEVVLEAQRDKNNVHFATLMGHMSPEKTRASSAWRPCNYGRLACCFFPEPLFWWRHSGRRCSRRPAVSQRMKCLRPFFW